MDKLQLRDEPAPAPLFARPEGTHYHVDRNCHMLVDGQFEAYGYIGIDREEIEQRELVPCPACVAVEQRRGRRSSEQD